MQWVYLIFADLLECVWSTTMKLSNGFSHLWWSIATIIGLVLSFLFLALSLKRLDISLAYPMDRNWCSWVDSSWFDPVSRSN